MEAPLACRSGPNPAYMDRYFVADDGSGGGFSHSGDAVSVRGAVSRWVFARGAKGGMAGCTRTATAKAALDSDNRGNHLARLRTARTGFGILALFGICLKPKSRAGLSLSSSIKLQVKKGRSSLESVGSVFSERSYALVGEPESYAGSSQGRIRVSNEIQRVTQG